MSIRFNIQSMIHMICNLIYCLRFNIFILSYYSQGVVGWRSTLGERDMKTQVTNSKVMETGENEKIKKLQWKQQELQKHTQQTI